MEIGQTVKVASLASIDESLLELTPDGIVLADPQGRIVTVNSQTEKLFGYSRSELVHQSIEMLMPVRFRQQHEQHRRAYMTTPSARPMGLGMDLYGLHKSGREIPIAISLNRIETDQGPMVFTAIRDVSAYRQAEQKISDLNKELERRNERLQLLLELAPDGIVIANSDGRITLVNSQIQKLFGYTRAELIDQKVEILMPERFRTRHVEHRHAYHQQPSPRPMGLGIELCGLHKSGSEFPIAVSLNRIETELGPMVFTAIRDVSPYRHAENKIRDLNEELERQNAQLQNVNQELEAFAYSVSHDLRAPLRSIVGFGQILVEEHTDRLDIEGLRLLGIIRNSATKMGRLIDELLAFSRLNRRAIEFEKVDMTALAREVFAEAVSHEKDRAIELQIDELPPTTGSASMLRQVWTNLIGNAVKYSRPRARAVIKVTSHVQQREVWYCVEDNGVGFDMRYAHKLFGVFERLHGVAEFEGTGVGLALVQRIIGRHDGRIWADSVLDQGSKFTFALPLERSNDAQ